jgi:hypothetical protein
MFLQVLEHSFSNRLLLDDSDCQEKLAFPNTNQNGADKFFLNALKNFRLSNYLNKIGSRVDLCKYPLFSRIQDPEE